MCNLYYITYPTSYTMSKAYAILFSSVWTLCDIEVIMELTSSSEPEHTVPYLDMMVISRHNVTEAF